MSLPWVPANRAERHLAWALTTGDIARYFRVFATTDLFQALGASGGAGPEGREFVTLALDGVTALPLFTSYEAMEGAVSDVAEAAVLTRYSHLRDTWPDPAWVVAVDPGLPIESYFPLSAVERGLRGEVEVDDPEVAIGRLHSEQWLPWPQGANQAVHTAVSIGDATEYLDALLDSMVTIATTRPPSGPGDYLGPQLPWRPAGSAQAPVIEVFTDPEAFARAYPDTHHMTIRFLALLPHWPAGHALAVNPDGPAGLDLPPEQVPLLLHWVREVGRLGAEARVPRPVLAGMRWAWEEAGHPATDP